MSGRVPPAVFTCIAAVLVGAALPQEIAAGFLPATLATIAGAVIFAGVAAVLVIENKNGGK